MFTRIWLWLRGHYVNDAIMKFETAKSNLVDAVEAEAEILKKHIDKRDAAHRLTSEIQATIKADYERMVAAEANRFVSVVDGITAKADAVQENIAKGEEILKSLGIK
jgi:uncharacterized protein YqeY